MRGRPWLWLAAVAVLLAVPAGSLANGSTVATETFSGQLEAYTGLDRVGPVELGAYPGGKASPEGDFSVPPAASTVRIQVDWTPRTPTVERFVFRLCEGPCDAPGARTLDEVTTTGPADLTVPVPSARELSWEAFVGRGAAVNATVEGTARYLAPAGEEAEPSTATAPKAPPQEPTGPGWTLVGGTIALAFAAGLIAWSRRVLGPWLVSLYHRIDEDERLEHPTRRHIRTLLEETPGLHANALRERLGLSRGQLEHHLGMLLDADLVTEVRATGYRCLFLPGDVDPAIAALADRLRSDTAQCVLAEAAESPGSSLTDLADAASVAISTVSYHVDNLEAGGLLDRERSGMHVAVEATDLGQQALRQLVPGAAERGFEDLP